MPQLSEEPLTKITLNLYKRDLIEFRRRFPNNYTEEIRMMIRRRLKALAAMDNGGYSPEDQDV